MSIPPNKRLAVYVRDAGICGICGEHIEPDDLDIDHIMQRAEGGPDDMDNLRAAHKSCNRGRPKVPKAQQVPLERPQEPPKKLTARAARDEARREIAKNCETPEIQQVVDIYHSLSYRDKARLYGVVEGFFVARYGLDALNAIERKVEQQP